MNKLFQIQKQRRIKQAHMQKIPHFCGIFCCCESRMNDSVELAGFEPATLCLQSRCATSCAIAPFFIRLLSKPYEVGPGGLEPPTSSLSGMRSNQLSYGPACALHKEIYYRLFFQTSNFLCRRVAVSRPISRLIFKNPENKPQNSK